MTDHIIGNLVNVWGMDKLTQLIIIGITCAGLGIMVGINIIPNNPNTKLEEKESN